MEQNGGNIQMVMFTGEYRHNLDPKNRLIIPSKYRDQLTTKIYVTEWMDGCLAAFAENEWNELVSKLNKLPITNKKARAFVRSILGKADECGVDNQGRILLPQFQISDRGFEKSCVIVGASDHFEIWPEKVFEQYNEESMGELEDFAEDLTELLQA